MKNDSFEARKEARSYKKKIERFYNERRLTENTRDFDQNDWQYEEENYRRRER